MARAEDPFYGRFEGNAGTLEFVRPWNFRYAPKGSPPKTGEFRAVDKETLELRPADDLAARWTVKVTRWEPASLVDRIVLDGKRFNRASFLD